MKMNSGEMLIKLFSSQMIIIPDLSLSGFNFQPKKISKSNRENDYLGATLSITVNVTRELHC